MGTAIDRFSQLYIAKGLPQQDSPRARRRVAATFSAILDSTYVSNEFLDRVASLLETECAARFPRPVYQHRIGSFLEESELRDFLDAVTLIYTCFAPTPRGAADSWKANVERIFREENLSYRVDGKGVVHFAIDQEFASNLASAVAVLEAPKFGAARAALERARADFSKASPDVLDATRNLFEAAESVFKTVTGSSAKLDEGEVKKTLAPFVDRKMKGADAIAKSGSGKLIAVFGSWVNSCHPYRHGHDAPEAIAPPTELAVMLMSTGAAYIRWLATLDAMTER